MWFSFVISVCTGDTQGTCNAALCAYYSAAHFMSCCATCGMTVVTTTTAATTTPSTTTTAATTTALGMRNLLRFEIDISDGYYQNIAIILLDIFLD